MPTTTYGSGNSARAAMAIPSTINTLYHQGERSNTAKSEFFAIFNFIDLPVGRRACSVRGNLWPHES